MIYYSIVLHFDDEPWVEAINMDDVYDGCARYFFDRYCYHFRHDRNTLKECMIVDEITNAHDLIAKYVKNCKIFYSSSNSKIPKYQDDRLDIYDYRILKKLNKLIADNQNIMFGN